MTYNTGKREQILHFLTKNASRSYTLEEICENIIPDGRGKSTVYRLTSQLTEKGILRRLSDGNTRHVTYQYVGDEACRGHLHLKCRDCGKLIHLDDEASHNFCEKLKESGFSIEDGSMLFGKCDSCNYAAACATDKEHLHK